MFLPSFLPPLEGGSARVPCQIIDLAGWVREGEVAEEKYFLRRITLTLTLSLQWRGKKDVKLSRRRRGKEEIIQGLSFLSFPKSLIGNPNAFAPLWE